MIPVPTTFSSSDKSSVASNHSYVDTKLQSSCCIIKYDIDWTISFWLKLCFIPSPLNLNRPPKMEWEISKKVWQVALVLWLNSWTSIKERICLKTSLGRLSRFLYDPIAITSSMLKVNVNENFYSLSLSHLFHSCPWFGIFIKLFFELWTYW